MRALTLRNPWAYAVTHLGKRIENRMQRPPAALVGKRIAIHAGRGYDYEGSRWIVERGLGSPRVPDGYVNERVEVRGAIVATAKIAAVSIEREREPDVIERREYDFGEDGAEDADAQRWMAEVASSPWYVGPVGIVLADVVVLPKPVVARGMQGYWPVSDADAVEVVAQEIIGRCAVEADGRVAAQKALAAWAGEYPGAHA